jgi:phosphatidylglycerol:prolipoprotein diacylglycerol transferase
VNGGEQRERAVAVPAATAFDVANQMLSWIGEQVVFARVGDVVVVTFGVLAGIGTLLAFTWMSVLWVGQGLSARHLLGIGLEGGVLTLVGSWLAAVLLDYRLLVTRPLEALRRPAFVSWGGILGALLALAVGAVWAHFDVLLLLDGFARGAPLGHAIGRIGCLTYGCCFGRETHGRLAITYTHPQSKAVRVGLLHGVRLHPAPLYEAVLHLVLFSVLNAAALLGAPRGLPAALCLVGYGLGRFAIEFSRDNSGRMLLRCLAVNQVISLGMAAVGVIALVPILAFAPAAPPIVWASVREAAAPLSVAVTAAATLIGAGFALQRKRVGSW